MRKHYLKILQLKENATEADIKKAYRRLSKKYHPDVNKGSNAQEIFMKINEAYEYLTSDQPKTVEYDEGLSERERWKQEHIRRSKQRAWEKRMYQMELIRQAVHYFRPVALIILIFNSLLVLDYYLPYSVQEQQVVEIKKVMKSRGKGTYTLEHRYDQIIFTDYTMRFDKNEILTLPEFETAVVVATPIFRKPMKVFIPINGVEEEHKQIYNIYRVFGYIIPGMLLVSLLFFILKVPNQRLNMATILVVFLLYQLYIFFSH